jgi:hypothetical protein
MAKKEKTSAKVGKIASSILKTIVNTPAKVKSMAASALSQRTDKKKRK